MAGYVPLPAFRAAPGFDFSGINEGLDTLGKVVEKNRLLAERQAIGKALQSGGQTGQTSSSSPQYGAQPTQNKLLGASRSPAQYGGSTTDFIKQQEGYTPNATWDRRQFSSGYGTRGTPGETVDRATAEQRLGAEVAPIDQWISQNIKVPLTPEQRTGLTSFAYNLGVDDLQKLSGDINSGNWSRVAERMPTFNKALNNETGQLEVVNGLTDRRMREAALVRGGGGPSAAPSSGGINYGAGANVALQQGNLSEGLSLLDAQRANDDTAYNRARQGRLDTRAEASEGQQSELRGMQIQGARAELEQAAQKRIAGIAQTIEGQTDEGQRQVLWGKFVGSNPKIATTLQAYGIDPRDHTAGSAFLIAEARGLQETKPAEFKTFKNDEGIYRAGNKGVEVIREPVPTVKPPVEVNGRLVQQQPDGSYKDVYTSPPKPTQLLAADKKEIIESDQAAQAGKSAVIGLNKAIGLNDQAYAGPLAQTRGYITSLFGSEGGKATEEVGNIITAQALDQLKAVFGGLPTEGERQILLAIQGSTNQAPNVRKAIWERGIDMAERRIDFNQRQSQALRSGEYYQPGYSPVTPDAAQQPRTSPPSDNAPIAVNSPQEYQALPPGTQYQAPDGSIRTKQ